MTVWMRGTWQKGISSRMVHSSANPIQKHVRLVRRLPGFFLVMLWLLMLMLPGGATLAFGSAAQTQDTPIEVPSGPTDFDHSVRLALKQSPFFTKSALEIEIRRLDEKDSKSEMFPSLTGTARYYPVQPKNNTVGNTVDYSYGVSTGNYNPLFGYLSYKASRLVTQIATLAHMKAISAGLERMGKAFLQLNAAETLAKLRAQATDLTRENLRYVKEQQSLGQVTPLEVQIASQETEVATAEQEVLISSRSRTQMAIKEFLGLRPDQPLQLETSQARRQVLGDFSPKNASLQEAESRNFDVRIKKLAQELQSWNVTLAKMRFVPSFNMALQSQDPLSYNGVQGAFFSIGLSFPIFDGFKRFRNIDRQKKALNQFASEETVKSDELSQKWREAEENLNSASTALRVSQAQAELARLKETQAETLYRTAEKDFSILMVARQNRVKAQMNVVKKALDYDLAVLELRSLSGDLVYHYVNENQFKK
jgi:outer membrane protein TolC